MQENPTYRSNTERTNATRRALIKAGRYLFIEHGYAKTSTTQIVKRAKITRGALYHHYKDKSDLFHAVLTCEAKAVGEQIEQQRDASNTGFDALVAGSDAYFKAMAVEGRTRLLLIDGPAVLGFDKMNQIYAQTSQQKLLQGLTRAMEGAGAKSPPLDAPFEAPFEALAELLAAAFDHAALAIAEGRPAQGYKDAIKLILAKLTV